MIIRTNECHPNADLSISITFSTELLSSRVFSFSIFCRTLFSLYDVDHWRSVLFLSTFSYRSVTSFSMWSWFSLQWWDTFGRWYFDANCNLAIIFGLFLRGSDCVFVVECWNIDFERIRTTKTDRPSFYCGQVCIDGLIELYLSLGWSFVGLKYLRLCHYFIDVCFSSATPSDMCPQISSPLPWCSHSSLLLPVYFAKGRLFNWHTASISVHSISWLSLAVRVLCWLRSAMKLFDLFVIMRKCTPVMKRERSFSCTIAFCSGWFSSLPSAFLHDHFIRVFGKQNTLLPAENMLGLDEYRRKNFLWSSLFSCSSIIVDASGSTRTVDPWSGDQPTVILIVLVRKAVLLFDFDMEMLLQSLESNLCRAKLRYELCKTRLFMICFEARRCMKRLWVSSHFVKVIAKSLTQFRSLCHGTTPSNYHDHFVYAIGISIIHDLWASTVY